MNKSFVEWIDYYENATKEDVIQDMMLDISSIKEKNKEIERQKEVINGMIDNEEKYLLEINRLKGTIKEVREKIEGVRIFGLRSGKTLIATLLNDILEILDKEK